MGELSPGMAIGVCHRMPSPVLPSHLTGTSFAGEIPKPPGPRNIGQLRASSCSVGSFSAVVCDWLCVRAHGGAPDQCMAAAAAIATTATSPVMDQSPSPSPDGAIASAPARPGKNGRRRAATAMPAATSIAASAAASRYRPVSIRVCAAMNCCRTRWSALRYSSFRRSLAGETCMAWRIDTSSGAFSMSTRRGAVRRGPSPPRRSRRTPPRSPPRLSTPDIPARHLVPLPMSLLVLFVQVVDSHPGCSRPSVLPFRRRSRPGRGASCSPAVHRRRTTQGLLEDSRRPGLQICCPIRGWSSPDIGSRRNTRLGAPRAWNTTCSRALDGQGALFCIRHSSFDIRHLVAAEGRVALALSSGHTPKHRPQAKQEPGSASYTFRGRRRHRPTKPSPAARPTKPPHHRPTSLNSSTIASALAYATAGGWRVLRNASVSLPVAWT